MDRPSILSLFSLLAERTIMGRFFPSLMRMMAERPSSLGIITSMIIRCIFFVATKSRASMPS